MIAIDHGDSISFQGRSIPKDDRNRDYRRLAQQIAAGDVTLQDAPAPPPPSREERRRQIAMRHLDAVVDAIAAETAAERADAVQRLRDALLDDTEPMRS